MDSRQIDQPIRGRSKRGSLTGSELLAPVEPRLCCQSGPRLYVSGGCRRWLKLCRGNPRTWSPLSRPRLCGWFSHIGLRSGATGPPRFGGRLDLLLDMCRSRFRCRRCRSHRCHGFPSQTKLFRQRRPVLGIRRGRERMIVPQAPPLPVFIPGEAVAAADMAA
jgi:hypothetical protein